MKIESYEDDFDSPDFWYFERICVSIKNQNSLVHSSSVYRNLKAQEVELNYRDFLNILFYHRVKLYRFN